MLSQATYIERRDADPMIVSGALSERQVLEKAIDATSYRHFGCVAQGGSHSINIEAVDRASLGVVEEHAPTPRRATRLMSRFATPASDA